MEQMDLLQAFEIIVDKAKNSSLGEKFYEEADSYLGFVSDKLDISKRASAIMALFADRCDDNIRYHDLEFIYKEDDAEWRYAKRNLSQGDHLFFVEKFIEYTNDDGFVDRESFKITDDAKKQLFSELNLSSMRGSRPNGGMLSFEDISPKQLFYNSKEQRQVEES